MVTGVTGFLGYHLVKELVANEVEVYALCRKDTANLNRIKDLKGVSIIEGSLEDVEKLPDLCKERDFDVLYHLAWRGASGEERANSVIQAENISWSLKLTQVAKTMGVKKIVVSGTVCENQCEAMIKNQYTGKSAYYLMAKRSTYEMLSVLCRQLELPLVWCTFYHPIGKYNKPEQLIMNTILKLKKGETPQFGPADKWFDVIAAEDLCHGFYLAGLVNLKKDRYFIGSGQPRILKDYLCEVQEIVNPELPLEFGIFKDDGLPMERSWLDATAFEVETGFQNRVEFGEAVGKVISEC